MTRSIPTAFLLLNDPDAWRLAIPGRCANLVGSTHSWGLVHLHMSSILSTSPFVFQLPSSFPGVGVNTHGTDNGHPGSQVDIGTGAGCPG